jgi:hypothetical protein
MTRPFVHVWLMEAQKAGNEVLAQAAVSPALLDRFEEFAATLPVDATLTVKHLLLSRYHPIAVCAEAVVGRLAAAAHRPEGGAT